MSNRTDTAIATVATLASLALGLVMLWLGLAANQRTIIGATAETHAQVARIEATNTALYAYIRERDRRWAEELDWPAPPFEMADHDAGR